VNVPELDAEPPEPEAVLVALAAGLLDFTAGLLELAEALVDPAAGLLALTEPPPELAGAAGEPPLAAELAGLVGWPEPA
jgi:hypothetical protein